MLEALLGLAVFQASKTLLGFATLIAFVFAGWACCDCENEVDREELLREPRPRTRVDRTNAWYRDECSKVRRSGR